MLRFLLLRQIVLDFRSQKTIDRILERRFFHRCTTRQRVGCPRRRRDTKSIPCIRADGFLNLGSFVPFLSCIRFNGFVSIVVLCVGVCFVRLGLRFIFVALINDH